LGEEVVIVARWSNPDRTLRLDENAPDRSLGRVDRYLAASPDTRRGTA